MAMVDGEEGEGMAQENLSLPALSGSLLGASVQGDVSEVERLLALGANPNAGGGGAISALGASAMLGAARVCALLIEAGADPDLGHANGDSPCHMACLGGHSRSVWRS